MHIDLYSHKYSVQLITITKYKGEQKYTINRRKLSHCCHTMTSKTLELAKLITDDSTKVDTQRDKVNKYKTS